MTEKNSLDKTPDSKAPDSKGSSSKTPVIILAVAVIIIAAVIFGKTSGSKEAYETFSLAMNKMAGEGNWSAKSHETAMTDGTLTVSGLNVKLPAVEAPAPAAAEGEEAAPPVTVSGPSDLNIATVIIKKGLDKKELEAILADPDWRDKKETRLADSIILKGIEQKNPGIVSPATEKPIPSVMTMQEAALENVTLAAAGADNPEGKAGFLKALRLGALSYKNIVSTATADGTTVELKAGLTKIEGLAFDGEPLTGLEALDPSGLISIAGAISAKSAVMDDASFTFVDADEKAQGAMGWKKLEEKDVAGFGKIGRLAFSGLYFNLTSQDDFPPISLALDNMTMNGFDMSGYIQKFLPAISAAVTDPETASMMLGNVQTLADIFVTPFSLEDVSMGGLEVKIGEAVAVRLAEGRASGPYVYGEIPVKQSSTMSGLEITLPEDPKYAEGDFAELYEFGKTFGMTRFVMDAAGETAYDEKTGVIHSRTTKFTIKDLADMTIDFEMGGLTGERLAVLKETPMQAIYFALMMPDQVFGDLSLNGFKLAITDKSLTERIFNYVAKSQFGSDDGKIIQAMAAGQVKLLMEIRGGEILKNPGDVSAPVSAFLAKPQQIEVSLAADPPLSFVS
ncbi:hypothetical protein LJB86_04325, partial [Deltaproteobacteria bacterium OttesenSCG-928-M10]|nr:hypothetical protein [Deltaproteobacteria bacterium OttesenSCG-928-M10]